MTTYIGTSWKMNKTTAEARGYARRLRQHTGWPTGVQAFVIPPHTSIHPVCEELGPTPPVWVGAQNAHWASSGAYTGEVSMEMVKDVGATLVELGHSERRHHFNETDESVRLKVAAALEADLVPLVCIGETQEERRAGRSVSRILEQVDSALADLDPALRRRVMLAYEPVWSIGERGVAATVEQIDEVVEAIRSHVSVRALLYGGSVAQDNAARLLGVDGIDGLFVGRSAWNADDLVALVELAGALRDPA